MIYKHILVNTLHQTEVHVLFKQAHNILQEFMIDWIVNPQQISKIDIIPKIRTLILM